MNKQEFKYLFLIFVIFIAACIETDIYLPAFPDMMHYFSVTEDQIQSMLTWNFFGICIAGPLYGPISDAIGRKTPLMIALGLFLTGSIITLYAHNFELMLWGRLLQGIGSGGCFTLGTAIIFDAFQAEKAIQATNQLNTLIPFVMAAAPMVGGYLNHIYGFRSNFLVIALFVLISFVICLFFLDEPLAKEKRMPFKTKKILEDFKCACTCLPFWQLTLVVSLLFAGYLAFLSISAVLFVLELGVSKHLFPLYQAAILAAWLIGSLTCTRAITKWGMVAVKKAGMALIILGAIGFALATWFTPQNPYLLTIGMLFYAFGANWVQGFYFPEGMELLPNIKGVTASVLTSMRLLLTAFVVGLAGALYNGTIYPLAAIVIAITIIIVTLVLFYEKRRGNHVMTQASIAPPMGH